MLMTGLDERVDLGRLRDLRGRGAYPWIRRALLALLGLVVVLAAAGVFGQPTRTLADRGAGADLRVDVPDVLRGGLMWRARIAVRTTRTIEHPRLILGAGFFEGMQFNTLEPAPASEANRGPRIVLSYDKLTAGGELVVYLQMQVNPTTVGEQDTSVQLDDATDRLVRVAHVTSVLP
jgi:hypothetical protein